MPASDAEAVAEYRESMQRLALAGTLAAGAGHDIANLVTAMGALLPRTPDDERAIAPLRAGVARLRAIARGFVDFARPRRERDYVDLSRIAAECADLMEATLREHGPIERSLAPEAIVWAAPGQLSQVIVNLLMNAGQAMDGRQGGIRLGVHQVGDRVHLAVSDDGCGMREERVESAFRAFATSGSGSAGLGLYVCHRIVTAHGGDIAIDSRIGVGTTVTVSLPVAAVPEDY